MLSLPSFTDAVICSGATITYPSTGSVTGSWSPSTIDNQNTGTATYTFTPDAGQCGVSTTPVAWTVTVNPLPDTPIGDANQNFTAGQTIADLSVIGDNLVWYSDSTYTNVLSDNEPLVNGETYYVVNQDPVTGCQSPVLAITVEEEVNRSDFDLFGFRYYPNPTRDILYFTSNLPISNVVISNLLGQQVNVRLSSDKTSLDMSNLPTGNYLVKVTIEGVSKMFKVVKQ